MTDEGHPNDKRMLSHAELDGVYSYSCDDYDINLYDSSIVKEKSFESAVLSWNEEHPGMSYPVDRCYVYGKGINLNAYLEGTVAVKIYKHKYIKDTRTPDPSLKPEYIGTCVITVTPDTGENQFSNVKYK